MANIFRIIGSIFKKKKPLDNVIYEVSGTPSGYNVTYTEESKQTIQNPDVPDGWKYSYKGKPGDYFYFSAQSNNKNATVNVKIYQHGEVFKEASNSGDFVLATVSGRLK